MQDIADTIMDTDKNILSVHRLRARRSGLFIYGLSYEITETVKPW